MNPTIAGAIALTLALVVVVIAGWLKKRIDKAYVDVMEGGEDDSPLP